VLAERVFGRCDLGQPVRAPQGPGGRHATIAGGRRSAIDMTEARRVLEDGSEEALELRFEVFMDEAEAHTDPAWGRW